MQNTDFENYLKNKLLNAKIEPPEDVWMIVRKKLVYRKIFKIFIFTMPVIIVAAFAILTLVPKTSDFDKKALKVNSNIHSNYTFVNIGNQNNEKSKLIDIKLKVINSKQSISPNFEPTNSILDTNNAFENWNIVNKKNICDTSSKQKQIFTETNVPKADFDVPTNIFTDAQTIFMNRSVFATKFKWFVNYDFVSDEKNLLFTFTKPDFYVITLIAEDSLGVSDTASKTILAISDSKVNKKYIAFPSAICPSISGPKTNVQNQNFADNSLFCAVVVEKNVQLYNLIILDRSGNIIFKTNKVSDCWDGYKDNKLVPIGVYVYIAEGVFEDGQKFKEYGSITVIY